MGANPPGDVSVSSIAIGLDVGGSSIKASVVDTGSGVVVGERHRIGLEGRWDRSGLVATIAECVNDLTLPDGTDPSRAAVGIGFPAVVVDGVIRTDPTALAHPGFRGVDLRAEAASALGAPVSVINDADAAALAEMRFGAGEGREGTVLVLTLGTGVGSGLFRDGRLVPNIELGHVYLAGDTQVAELHMAARIKTEQNLSWDEYGRRLGHYLDHVHRLFSPDLVVLGGGITESPDLLLAHLDTVAPVEVARLRNDAGLIGAATRAREDAS